MKRSFITSSGLDNFIYRIKENTRALAGCTYMNALQFETELFKLYLLSKHYAIALIAQLVNYDIQCHGQLSPSRSWIALPRNN